MTSCRNAGRSVVQGILCFVVALSAARSLLLCETPFLWFCVFLFFCLRAGILVTSVCRWAVGVWALDRIALRFSFGLRAPARRAVSEANQ